MWEKPSRGLFYADLFLERIRLLERVAPDVARRFGGIEFWCSAITDGFRL